MEAQINFVVTTLQILGSLLIYIHVAGDILPLYIIETYWAQQ
jgi:hypothetical protein